MAEGASAAGAFVTNTMLGTQNKRVSAVRPVCPTNDLVVTSAFFQAAYKYDVDKAIQWEACIHTRVMHNELLRLVYVENSSDPAGARSLAISDNDHRRIRHSIERFNAMCHACSEHNGERTHLCRWCYEVVTRRADDTLEEPLLCRFCRIDSARPSLNRRCSSSVAEYTAARLSEDSSFLPYRQCPSPLCNRRVRRVSRDRSDRAYLCNRCLLHQAHTCT